MSKVPDYSDVIHDRMMAGDDAATIAWAILCLASAVDRLGSEAQLMNARARGLPAVSFSRTLGGFGGAKEQVPVEQGGTKRS